MDPGSFEPEGEEQPRTDAAAAEQYEGRAMCPAERDEDDTQDEVGICGNSSSSWVGGFRLLNIGSSIKKSGDFVRASEGGRKKKYHEMAVEVQVASGRQQQLVLTTITRRQTRLRLTGIPGDGPGCGVGDGFWRKRARLEKMKMRQSPREQGGEMWRERGREGRGKRTEKKKAKSRKTSARGTVSDGENERDMRQSVGSRRANQGTAALLVRWIRDDGAAGAAGKVVDPWHLMDSFIHSSCILVRSGYHHGKMAWIRATPLVCGLKEKVLVGRNPENRPPSTADAQWNTNWHVST
ncbi:hypothetical protein P170DRAFT_465341 [Aspergillus steynii IBT 23096]|uniref:Uncharacterized protein n=1 Tax=Aspergillus steynii IBT 23096 TaxID=1392250 RepID=A0A2I2G4G1_9EURO|nr:uncharacterized protein P170DRAFT_465341 [Aspergillus steynii IBT 23096]PLB47770.1 hypothetical protein P170DRAFT_465341 [Aspergillus steynii IBT 23096]